MKRAAALLALLLGARAGAEIGAVNILNKVCATRAEAVGGAATALGRDATLVWLNPAAPSLATDSSLTLAGQRGFFGEMLGQGVLTSPLDTGVLSFGCMYYDAGSLNVYTPDGSRAKMSIQQDFMGLLAWSRPLTPALSGGVALKGLNSVLFGENSSAAVAADAGVQYRLNGVLKIGAAVQNVGTALKYRDDRINLPTLARGGVAFGTRVGNRDVLLLTGDAEMQVAGRQVTWSGGAEYQWNGTASLRAGARMAPARQLGYYSFGAGIVFHQYRIDYSVRLGGEFDSPQTLSLTMAFPRQIEAVALPAVPAAIPASEATAPDLTAPANGELAAPEILPGQAAPLPMVKPQGDTGDDLNRELDELIKKKNSQ